VYSPPYRSESQNVAKFDGLSDIAGNSEPSYTNSSFWFVLITTQFIILMLLIIII